MDLGDLIRVDGVIPALKVGSKRQVLQEIAARAGRITGRPEREIFECLVQRERLGSTGIGHGIAIPHASLAGLPVTLGLFARLERPVDFEAIDDLPVDLVCALLTPDGAGADHLQALARIARVLRDGPLAAKLRATHDRNALYAMLVHSAEPNAA